MSDSANTEVSVEEEIDQLALEADAQDRGFSQSAKPTEPPATNEEDPPDGGGEGGEGAESDELENLEQSNNSGTEPETGQALSDSQSVFSQKTNRQEKKDQALVRSWENANRRHEEAKAKEEALNAREAQLLQREQVVNTPAPEDPLPKYSAGQIAETAAALIEEGDIDTAKTLVSQLAAKAEATRLARDTGPTSPAFQQAWSQYREHAIRNNPELNDAETPLYREATDLLEGDWGPILKAHPAGVAAAQDAKNSPPTRTHPPAVKTARSLSSCWPNFAALNLDRDWIRAKSAFISFSTAGGRFPVCRALSKRSIASPRRSARKTSSSSGSLNAADVAHSRAASPVSAASPSHT